MILPLSRTVAGLTRRHRGSQQGYYPSPGRLAILAVYDRSRVSVVLALLYAGSGSSRALLLRALTTTRSQPGMGHPSLVPVNGRSWLAEDPGRGAPGRRTLMSDTTDTRIVGYEPLLSPSALFLELPLGDAQSQTVEATRAEVRAVLDDADDRLLVVT